MVSVSSGSDAAKRIASTCLSIFETDDGKLIILSFLVSIAFDKQSEKVIDPQVEEQLKEILDFIRNPNITINE